LATKSIDHDYDTVLWRGRGDNRALSALHPIIMPAMNNIRVNKAANTVGISIKYIASGVRWARTARNESARMDMAPVGGALQGAVPALPAKGEIHHGGAYGLCGARIKPVQGRPFSRLLAREW
jgi:hypothetical protein